MIAAWRSIASTRNTSLLWLAVGLATMVAACSNQITYSRIGVDVPDGGTGGATLPGSGGSGDGGSGAGGAGTGGNLGTGGADAGTDTPIGSGGMLGSGGAGIGGAGIGGMVGTGGTGTGGAGMGGMGTGGMGMGGAGVGGAIVDNAQFNFEATAQGWAATGPWTGTGRMTAQHFAGAASLGATLTYTPPGSGDSPELWLNPAAGTGPVAGNVVTFHVFLPANAAGVVAWVQPYVQDGSAARTFTGAYTPAMMLTFGGWNTITLSVPADAVLPISKMAVQLSASGSVAFTGNIYVDSVGW